MSDIYLQLAVSEDVQILQDSALAAFSADVDKYGAFPPNIESIDWFHSEVGKGHFYKVLCDGEFAGAICVECGDQSSIEIKYVYIALKFQNKHIGFEVMRLIEEQYSDIKYWSLLTPYKSYRNHHFYEKLGYKKVGEFQPDASDDFRVFEYSKTLTC
ncbi:GNAT family N-acetyltransferase [Vibrio sp. YMD68]|uniref:GNAT family N-acetyltransferase n=1 Tax=Vibrio sp. YMD68 TaxID=3042300 RepID=UPI002499F8AD|nr:GNAT family N-acetyltransferase [Vibrio sp. YMD68]WGV98058.1 GNAT family N-acetyltransferase [Vibrio sp. YMD68]